MTPKQYSCVTGDLSYITRKFVNLPLERFTLFSHQHMTSFQSEFSVCFHNVMYDELFDNEVYNNTKCMQKGIRSRSCSWRTASPWIGVWTLIELIKHPWTFINRWVLSYKWVLARESSSWTVSGVFSSILGQNYVSKCNELHVVIFWLFFINLGNIS